MLHVKRATKRFILAIKCRKQINVDLAICLWNFANSKRNIFILKLTKIVSQLKMENFVLFVY